MVEGSVKKLDSLLVLHRDLTKKESKKLSHNIFLSNLGHVAEKVVTDVEVGGEAELVEGFRVDVLHTWDGGWWMILI